MCVMSFFRSACAGEYKRNRWQCFRRLVETFLRVIPRQGMEWAGMSRSQKKSFSVDTLPNHTKALAPQSSSPMTAEYFGGNTHICKAETAIYRRQPNLSPSIYLQGERAECCTEFCTYNKTFSSNIRLLDYRCRNSLKIQQSADCT